MNYKNKLQVDVKYETKEEKGKGSLRKKRGKGDKEEKRKRKGTTKNGMKKIKEK